jgi:hypothetical protein
MSQVNNEKPIINREHEEQSQSWGQPSSSSSVYPSNIDSDRNFSYANQLASSSSSLFDRNNAILHESNGIRDNTNYQQQAQTSQYRSLGASSPPKANVFRQQQQEESNTSSYSKISHLTNQQQSGSQYVHDVPHFHGFRFQTLPGLFLR